jgi:hypothetical protein
MFVHGLLFILVYLVHRLVDNLEVVDYIWYHRQLHPWLSRNQILVNIHHGVLEALRHIGYILGHVTEVDYLSYGGAYLGQLLGILIWDLHRVYLID